MRGGGSAGTEFNHRRRLHRAGDRGGSSSGAGSARNGANGIMGRARSHHRGRPFSREVTDEQFTFDRRSGDVLKNTVGRSGVEIDGDDNDDENEDNIFY